MRPRQVDDDVVGVLGVDELGVEVVAADVGLLKPSGRTEGGFRLYTEADMDKILVIRRMKPLGFSLDQMRSVMSDLEVLEDPAADERARSGAGQRLADIQQDAAERREKLSRQLDMADEFIHLLSRR